MDRKEELISIIIPIYNGEKFLRNCIESILNQTYYNIEIILINDGSIDKTRQICEEYIKKDSRIIYKEQENKGVSAARNLGLEFASGNFCLFVDVDDYMELNALEMLYDVVKKYNSDIVIFNYYTVDKYIIKNRKYDIYKKNINANEFVEFMLSNEYYKGFLWNKLISRKIIAEYRFDENIHIMEDIIFLLEISKNINNVYILDEYLYFYVQHNLSALHVNNVKRLSNYLAYEKIINYIVNNNVKLLDDDYFYIWNYVYSFMYNYGYMKNNNILLEENELKRKNVIKNMFKVALRRKINIINKIKLMLIFYFPSIYYKLKQRNNSFN